MILKSDSNNNNNQLKKNDPKKQTRRLESIKKQNTDLTKLLKGVKEEDHYIVIELFNNSMRKLFEKKNR